VSAWTTERVLALAPDPSSASAGQGLASPKKWSGMGRSERALWGLCQGSGKSPYQVRVDLSEPAFKCTCPSRKFPCKHGIGLFLIFVKDAAALKQADEPDWVGEWLEGRAEKAEKKAANARQPAEKRPVDVETQAKRAAQRDERVRDGVAECRVWLEDLVRRGLAAAQSEPGSFWERAAARMVDAQAPGLARLIRRLPEAIASGEGWPRRTLDRLGRLYLLLRAAERIKELPADLGEDVRVGLGWTQSKDAALAGTGVSDHWLVLGQVTEEEERLRVRRTWLVGRDTGRSALVLDFAAGGAPLDPSLVAGTGFDGEVAYYPSVVPLRGLVKSRAGAAAGFAGSVGTSAAASFESALAACAGAMARNPWLERWPLVMQVTTPALSGDRWMIIDGAGHALPLKPGFAQAWRLMAMSGGRPLGLMGEWDGEWVLPLSAWPLSQASAFIDVAPRWAA
jgi:SWIM zinc finger